MLKSSFVIELFERIHRLKLSSEQNTCLNRLKYQCKLFLCALLVFYLTQCHIRIYNAWAGPFHMNFDELITHWKISKGILLNLFQLNKEYLQIEFGQDKIHPNSTHIFKIYEQPTDRQFLYKLNFMNEQNLTEFPMQLFVRLPTDLQTHFHQRFPYRFELFTPDTLICITEQVYPADSQKPVDIRLIEEIYDLNATDFNMKVISKCGILIGHLYEYPNEVISIEHFNQSYKFIYYVTVFDVYSSYTPYKTYLFTECLVIGFILQFCINLFQYLSLVFLSYQLIISLDTQLILKRLNIHSIQTFDFLLMTVAKENNYHNQLFLLQNQYLIIFKINLNEYDSQILSQFYTTSPFDIIEINSIIAVNSNYISFLNGLDPKQIVLLQINNNETAIWLHNRLMDCSVNYRQTHQKSNLLDRLIDEEEEIQRIIDENDFRPMGLELLSVSPNTIAKFRLEGGHIVTSELFDISCSICFEIYQPEDTYSQWPCPAQHIFHHNCMLNVLRRRNHCPLCRHIFEDKDSLDTDADSESDWEA